MKRLVAGGFTTALISALVVVTAPTGSQAADQRATAPQDASGRAVASARALVADPPRYLHASPHDAFRAQPVQSFADLRYVPYERTYRGLPVVGGDFVVATDADGQILGTTVAQRRDTSLRSVAPRVAKADARATSARLVQDATVGATRLVVLQRDASRLAWETLVTGTRSGEASRLSVYVDARDGRVLETTEHVVSGSGTAAYSGPNPLSLNTTLSGSTYSMRDPSSPTRVCQDSATNATFSGSDDLWGNGSATSKETGCVDAYYGTQVMKAMMSSWLGRNGMDNNNGWVPMRVGLNDVNAYYDGTQVQIGHSQSGGRWIGSIDVVAHEYGHAVDDHTPGGISGSGTQEFIGDVFGALTEFYSNQSASYDPPDYLVGEEVNLVGAGPIRNMYNPSAVGDPNCYSSSIPSTEVHAAAGPGNHFFYLLAEGSNPTNGQPTSPTCNGSTVSGIGIQKAGRIMYNAMLMKTSGASYLKYRTWTLTAAKNLYPGSCAEFNAVKAAWNAVSVPAQTADPTCSTGTNTVTVANPGSQTGTVGTARSLQMTATDSQAGQTFTWSATGLPSGLSINASTGLISGTPTASGTFSSTVTARDTTGATGSATFSWTISGTGGGCSGQKLGNPGFETGTASPWSASSGVVDSSTGQPARSGSWKAWLDGYGSSHTDTLSQSVSIPAGCRATLTFYLHVDTAETTSTTAYDRLTVKAGSTTLATYSNLNRNTGYALRSFDVSSFAGQTVTISFSGVEDSSLQTSFVIDDTALTLG